MTSHSPEATRANNIVCFCCRLNKFELLNTADIQSSRLVADSQYRGPRGQLVAGALAEH